MNETKNLRTFYIFPVMYIISVYLFPVFLSLQENFPFLSYLMYTPVVFGVLNIIVAVKCCKPEYHDIMLNSAVLVKYSMIPFFILGGIMIVACLLLSIIPLPFMILFGPFMAFVCCVIGWLILAFESPYTISYLCISRKSSNGATKVMAVLHGVLQFFFMADVFDVMYLTLREKKWTKLTITLLVLMGTVLIVLFVLLVFGIVKFIL